MSDYQINNSNQSQAQRVTPSMRAPASKAPPEQRTTALDAPGDPQPVFERADFIRHELMREKLAQVADEAFPDKNLEKARRLFVDPTFPMRDAIDDDDSAKPMESLAKALLSSQRNDGQNPLMDV